MIVSGIAAGWTPFIPLMRRCAARFTDIEPQVALQLFLRFFKQQNNGTKAAFAAGVEIEKFNLDRQADVAGHHVPQRVQVGAKSFTQCKPLGKVAIETLASPRSG
ncbi:Uncharacterised protein [Serratia fonticola]|uniref:Uncharacterized protein n=1 Tax=Serratia fonticola TaxID=47917 RepID=A0A4U9W9Q2_SERFO|nr:Uncharacterised protein [Serratia fonticola]